MNTYKYILFDVDGVLAKAQNTAAEVLKENNITIEEFFQGWDVSRAVFDFETGSSTPAEFSEARGEELDRGLQPDAVMKILAAQKSVLYNGVEELLDKLYKRKFTLACLSNTNVLHWNSIEGKEIFDRYFFRKFLSHEMGLMKPQKEIYQVVLDTLQCSAREILYFDDSGRNIEAALELGFQAVRVKDFDDMAKKIESC
ncbi:MAG TPA: HAD family phosphatase [Lachnospiraceae bacterium]|nr:HAD family phosphatase [Lachnospiraceae bacterium]